MITIRAVASTADFDFDRLYADSYPDMAAGSYPWPNGMTAPAARKDYFRAWIDSVILDTTNFLGMVISIDGVDMIYFTIWFTERAAYIQCAMVAYDGNQSKAYHADQEFIDTWKAYLFDRGATAIGVFMVKNSPIRQVVMDVYSIPERAMEPYGEDCEWGVMP